MPFHLPANEADLDEKHKQSFLNEIQKGNPEILHELSALYACHWSSIRSRKTGDTACHIAARSGHFDLVALLIRDWEWYPNVTNNAGKTPLHEAAQFSRHEIVQHLLSFGGNPGCIKQGDWTPLMLACTKTGSDACKTVEHLLRAGADVRNVNKDGWTALHVAVRSGDLGIFRLMMRYYDAEDVNSLRTKNGRSLLHIACLHGNVDITRELLLNYKATVNAKDSCGQSPLAEAIVAEESGVEITEMLLENGADSGDVNGAGLSVLHLAAGNGQLDVLEYIVNKLGLDPNLQSSKLRLTPLHVAARQRRTDAMDVLRKYGAWDSILDEHGRSPDYYLNLKFK